jgi:hypothetical protein
MTTLRVRPAQNDEIAALGYGHLLTYPGFHAEQCRVGVHEQIDCCVLMQRHHMQYGRSSLRAVILHLLNPRCNDNDLAAVITDTLAYVKEQGAHLAIVRNCGEPCEAFGFSAAWPQYRMHFDSRRAALLHAPHRLRPAAPRDLPRIAELYHWHWAGRVGFQRGSSVWDWHFNENRDINTQVIIDVAGQVRGYIAGQDFLDDPVEIVVETPHAAATLLSAIGKLHVEAGSEHISWIVPPDDALIDYTRQHLDVTVSAFYPRSGGWAARLIDLPGLVEALTPEISAQAEATLPNFRPSSLIFRYTTEGVQIGLRRQQDTYHTLTPRDLIQTMFSSINTAVGVYTGLHPAAVRLVQALFPPRITAIAPLDWLV